MKPSPSSLTQIPGVGKSIAQELKGIGVFEVSDLVDRDPEELYLQLCDKNGTKVDRCVLYVFRCSVYYATVTNPDPDLLKWWNWKDEKTSNKGLHRTKMSSVYSFLGL